MANQLLNKVASYETAGNTAEANNTIIATRKTAVMQFLDKQTSSKSYDYGIDSWITR